MDGASVVLLGACPQMSIFVKQPCWRSNVNLITVTWVYEKSKAVGVPYFLDYILSYTLRLGYSCTCVSGDMAQNALYLCDCINNVLRWFA